MSEIPALSLVILGSSFFLRARRGSLSLRRFYSLIIEDSTDFISSTKIHICICFQCYLVYCTVQVILVHVASYSESQYAADVIACSNNNNQLHVCFHEHPNNPYYFRIGCEP